MVPVYLLQIVEAGHPHPVVRLQAGGALERDLIAVCTDAIVAKGVGFFKTEAQVKQAITNGITEAIRTLKHETKALI